MCVRMISLLTHKDVLQSLMFHWHHTIHVLIPHEPAELVSSSGDTENNVIFQKNTIREMLELNYLYIVFPFILPLESDYSLT